MWIKKTSKIPYLELVGSIEAKITTVPYAPLDKRSVWIRHDVDKSLDHALRLAEYEYKNNIQATYFLLHTAPYFDYSQDFAEKITLLVGYGHKIGFHNDVLGVDWGLNVYRSIEIIAKALNFLRKYDGNVVGTSCHGYVECYDRKYFNYQIWDEYDPEKNEGFPINWYQLPLKEFNLEYEAYFLPYTHYHSDSGGNDIGYVVNGQKPFERAALQSNDNIKQAVILDFNKQAEGLFQLLVHPCWWEEV